MSLLEGNELEKDLGAYGKATVDVTPELKLKVSVVAEVDLVAEAKKLALKTETPVDDAALDWLQKLVAAASVLK